MAGRMKYSKDRVVNALRRTRGNITEAAELLGAGVNTVRRYVTIYQIDVERIGVDLDLDAIRKGFEVHYGNISLTAKQTGISRPTIYDYVRQYPDLEAYRADCEKRLIEMAEAGLAKHIQDGVLPAITFLLRTKGGYRTNGNITVSGDEDKPLVVKVIRAGEVYDDE